MSTDTVDEIRQAYAGKLLPHRQLRWLQSPGWSFATRTVRKGIRVRALPMASRTVEDFPVRSADAQFDLVDYVSRNRVAGLLILQRGLVVHEQYQLGIDADVRWTSMSMAKSISTTLVGAAIQDGLIGSVDDSLTRYLPELAGGSYDDLSIRHLLQMTSGVRWDDSHTDPNSERRHMLELQIAQQPGSILRYVGSRPRCAPPGTVWNYSTGETHVVGALVRAVCGRWLSDYLSEKIWSRVGMQADASWWLESAEGLEVAGSGLSATLRDYVRFGLFMLEDGIAGDVRVLPEGWVSEATAPREVGGELVPYGYMWWPVASRGGTFEDRAFSARGIFGQYLYVNPARELLIAVLSARSKPKGAEAIADNDFFNSVVEAFQ